MFDVNATPFRTKAQAFIDARGEKRHFLHSKGHFSANFHWFVWKDTDEGVGGCAHELGRWGGAEDWALGK